MAIKSLTPHGCRRSDVTFFSFKWFIRNLVMSELHQTLPVYVVDDDESMRDSLNCSYWKSMILWCQPMKMAELFLDSVDLAVLLGAWGVRQPNAWSERATSSWIDGESAEPTFGDSSLRVTVCYREEALQAAQRTSFKNWLKQRIGWRQSNNILKTPAHGTYRQAYALVELNANRHTKADHWW